MSEDVRAELRDRLAAFLCEGEGTLWDDVFPRVPWEVWAEQVLAEISAAGFVVIRKDHLLWLQRSNYYGSRWAAENPIPEAHDGE